MGGTEGEEKEGGDDEMTLQICSLPSFTPSLPILLPAVLSREVADSFRPLLPPHPKKLSRLASQIGVVESIIF